MSNTQPVLRSLAQNVKFRTTVLLGSTAHMAILHTRYHNSPGTVRARRFDYGGLRPFFIYIYIYIYFFQALVLGKWYFLGNACEKHPNPPEAFVWYKYSILGLCMCLFVFMRWSMMVPELLEGVVWVTTTRRYKHSAGLGALCAPSHRVCLMPQCGPLATPCEHQMHVY